MEITFLGGRNQQHILYTALHQHNRYLSRLILAPTVENNTSSHRVDSQQGQLVVGSSVLRSNLLGLQVPTRQEEEEEGRGRKKREKVEKEEKMTLHKKRDHSCVGVVKLASRQATLKHA